MQIASGRHKQEIYAWHHLIGRAPGFAGLLIGSRRSIGGAARVRMPCGKLLFETELTFHCKAIPHLLVIHTDCIDE